MLLLSLRPLPSFLTTPSPAATVSAALLSSYSPLKGRLHWHFPDYVPSVAGLRAHDERQVPL